MFTSLEDAVTALSYHYSQDIEEESFLLAGDAGGSIRIIYFSSIGRGPFKSKPGLPLLSVRYEKVLRGLVPGFRVAEFKYVHTDSIRQIEYYKLIHSVVSVAGCSAVSMSVKDIGGKTSYAYKVPKGFHCFTVSNAQLLIATGGPDCVVRVWNPYMPDRPIASFIGHHAGILGIILQSKGKKLCSISKDKCVKIWNISTQVVIKYRMYRVD